MYNRGIYNPLDIEDRPNHEVKGVYRFDKDQIAVISNDLAPSIEQHRQDDTLRGRPLTAQQ